MTSHDYHLLSTDSDKLRDLAYLLNAGADAIDEAGLLRKEVEYWKAEHMKLLDSSIKHGESMMSNVLKLCLEKKT